MTRSAPAAPKPPQQRMPPNAAAVCTSTPRTPDGLPSDHDGVRLQELVARSLFLLCVKAPLRSVE